MAKSTPISNSIYPQSSLYIGDLPGDVQESQLFEKFSSIGPVLSIRICRDAITKASLGYGYINFSKPTDAERALEELNFEAVAGHPVRLMWSHRDPTLRRSGEGNIFIKNLDKSVDNKHLYDTFSSFGKILSAKVALHEDGTSKGFAFVHFETQESANEAIEKVNGKLIHHKPVFVGKFKSRAVRAAEMGDAYPKFTNVYLKNLPADTTEDKLRAMVEKFGSVASLFLPTDQETKAARGFAFVNFANSDAAHKAVAELNGKEVEEAAEKEKTEKEGEKTETEKKDGEAGAESPTATTRKLFAGRAMKKEEREAELRHRREARRRQVASQRAHSTNLYIKNLEEEMTEEKLREEFGKFGSITSAKIMTDEKGMSRGFGFVAYAGAEEATKAMQEMNGRILISKPLYVALAQRKAERHAFLTNRFMQKRQGNLAGGGDGAGLGGGYGTRGGRPASALDGQSSQPSYGQHQMGNFYSNTGYSGGAPAFVANARAHMGAGGSGRWGGARYAGGASIGTGYPSYGPAARAARNYAHPTATRLIQGQYGADGATAGRWSGAGSGVAQGGYHLQYHPGARNRPVDSAYSHSAGKSAPANDAPPTGHPAHTQSSPSEEKCVLGEQLYPLVAEMVEGGKAGKVTGMLLEMPNDEIIKLLHQQSKLQAKVDEAVNVLVESGMKV